MSSPAALPPRARSSPFYLWPIHSVTLLWLFLRAVSINVWSLCGGAPSLGGGGGLLDPGNLKCIPESTYHGVYAVLYGFETWYLAVRK